MYKIMLFTYIIYVTYIIFSFKLIIISTIYIVYNIQLLSLVPFYKFLLSFFIIGLAGK